MAGNNKRLFDNLAAGDLSYLLDPSLDEGQDIVPVPDGKETTAVPLEKLHPFKNHPFRVDREADDFFQLVESIKDNGIIYPVLVRPRGDEYEIIAGHRRTAAGEAAGLKEIPVIIKPMSDYEATIIMVHSNFQRETMLVSEKAKAYRMCMEAEKHQGRKGIDTAAMIGKEHDSKRQVYRYIRLSYLLDDLLSLVDAGAIPINTGVELAYLNLDTQREICTYIDSFGKYPSAEQASRLRKIYAENKESLSYERIIAELTEIPKAKTANKVSFKTKELTEFFEEGTDAETMSSTILQLLSRYRNGDFDEIMGRKDK